MPGFKPSTFPRLLAFGLLAFGFLAPARAELVILTDGNVMKVASFEATGDVARLTYPSGGRLSMPITRVERVVDDEVVPEPEPPPVVAEELRETAIPLRFEEAQAKIPEGPYGDMIFDAARRHSVNPQVVAALIGAESAGNPRAVSHKGARGLMQLMPATAERFGTRKEKLYDPKENLEAGIRYLSWLAEQFPNDLAKVLAAYNAGENAVVRYGGIPPYRETRNYVRRIYSTLGLAVTGL
ncbi:MAG TPA: lytic transglycosylase domain-containing protein [Thermoanaerobaculia bacterium]